jgi:anti-sigma-K factor RskA
MSRRRVRPAEVVLGVVDQDDEREVQRLLSDDPLFAAEVERLRGTIAMLEELGHTAWRPEPPPPLQTDHAVTVRAPRRRRPWLAGAAAGAAAVAAAVVALVVTGGGDGVAPSRTIALHALGGVPGSATIEVRGSEAELRGTGMPPSGPHDYYEAWLQDRKGRMVPMGTFRVARDGSVDAQMPVAVDLADYDLVDVSLEPDDGNPAHSSRSVMRAQL